VIDSAVYGHLWGTEETRELFSDAGRTRMWLDIIRALAAEQAALGLIPAEAARQIAGLPEPDLAKVGEQTRATGHSTLGLIRVLRESLGPEGAEWVYYGATVQDVTDTWCGLVSVRMLAILRRDLTTIERALLELARCSRARPSSERSIVFRSRRRIASMRTLTRPHHVSVDRKSTRLNSSHIL